jgi:predicted signal transduction protein with EAL and GGDEF domain
MDQGRPMEIATESRHTADSRDGVVGTSRELSRDMTYVDIATSFAGATGIVLLVPVAILLVGLPVVLSVRGVVEVLGWLFGFMAS